MKVDHEVFGVTGTFEKSMCWETKLEWVVRYKTIGGTGKITCED